MKIRIPFLLATITLFLWSCDEPTPYKNNDFIYIPFTLIDDTLTNVTSISHGNADLDWGAAFRAWVGETRYYKSGFESQFLFADSTLDIAGADSIQVELFHVKTFSENGADSLDRARSLFGFYNTAGHTIDIDNAVYGLELSLDSMAIEGATSTWKYTVPVDIINPEDTTFSLGVFPGMTGYMTALYGSASVSRPLLKFYYHEPDTAGLDSVTYMTFQADTLIMHFMEKSAAFDRTQYSYISQLKRDSLILTLDLDVLSVSGDTLQHIMSASLMPGIDDLASAMYAPDTVQLLSILVEEPSTGLSTTLLYGESGYVTNQIRTLLQPAIDAKESQVDLIISADSPGYLPGFLAISKDVSESSLEVQSSLAVRP